MKSTTQSHISLPENFHHTPAASNGRSFSVPPRRYSDGRPYYSLNAWLKDQFGQKIYKLALDGGMTCPNRYAGNGRLYFLQPRRFRRFCRAGSHLRDRTDRSGKDACRK